MKSVFAKSLSFSATLSIAVLTHVAYAGPTVCSSGVCTVTIAADPNSPTSNFQSPGATATSGYTITTSDSGGFFRLTLNDADPNALPFTNLYFDTIASTPGTGSNLGFSFGANGSAIAFDPDTSDPYSLVGTGVTSTFTIDSNGVTDVVLIPNSFFLTNPDGMPFTNTTSGDLVSLHLSQSFGYSVVGGSANFPAPVELGDATVTSATVTPEPSSFVLLGTGLLGVCGAVRRRFVKG